MSEFIIGLTSSFLASATVYPVDVVKTQYQVSKLPVKNIVSNIIKTDGVYGFYRGLPPHLMTYPIFWGVYFQTDKYKLNISNHQYVNKVASSLFASTVASTVANPLFVIKTRLQTENLKSTKSITTYSGMVRNIYRFEGVPGYFKGLYSTVLGNSKLAIQFPLYDYINEKTGSVVVSSLLAKTVSSTILYPTDLIRVQQRDSIKKMTIVDISKTIFKERGISGFYRGCLLYNMVSVPNFVLLMVFRDMFNSYK